MDLAKQQSSETITSLLRTQRKSQAVSLVLVILALVLFFAAVNLGDAKITPQQIARIVWGKMTFQPHWLADIPAGLVSIVWDIRLPRILAALLVGSGLSVSGAVFQSLLMNPLADPYTIGISTGAAFGASLAIYFSLILETAFLPVLPAAFLGALLTLLLVTLLANRSAGLNAGNLIIAGIIVSSILSAGITFLKNAAGEDVAAIVQWLMGSLSARSWSHVLLLFPLVLLGCLVCFRFSHELNILCAGEDRARILGVPVRQTRWILLVTASLITAACVSVSGIIGFVGLVIPHLIRFSLTSDNQHLLPLSAVLGGLLLLFADSISRVLFISEIPVGVLTTLIGGPYFLFLFLRKNSQGRAGL